MSSVLFIEKQGHATRTGCTGSSMAQHAVVRIPPAHPHCSDGMMVSGVYLRDGVRLDPPFRFRVLFRMYYASCRIYWTMDIKVYLAVISVCHVGFGNAPIGEHSLMRFMKEVC